MILGIANDIEASLESKRLVGKKIGSGFCFLDNSRDVQFEYASQEVKDYFSKIEEAIKNVSSQHEDIEISLRFKKDSFSFYVKPIEKPENDDPIPEAPDPEAEKFADEGIDTESYKRGWQDCVREMMEKLKSIKNK